MSNQKYFLRPKIVIILCKQPRTFRSCFNIKAPPAKKIFQQNAQSYPSSGNSKLTLKEFKIDKVFLNCAYLVHEIFILRKLSQIIRHGFKVVLGILFDLHIKQSGCFRFQQVLPKLLL